MPKVSNIAFKFDLREVMRVTQAIEERPKSSINEISEKLLMPEPKVEAYRNWAYFIGLIDTDANNRFYLSEFGKRRKNILTRRHRKLFFEICHFFLLKRNKIARAIFLEGYQRFNEKYANTGIPKSELIKSVEFVLPSEKIKKNFYKYITNILNSLVDPHGLGTLRILRVISENKYQFNNYELSLNGLNFCLKYLLFEQSVMGHGTTYLPLSKVFASEDSIMKMYLCNYSYLRSKLEELKFRKIIVIEEVSDLNQITFSNDLTNIEQVFSFEI